MKSVWQENSRKPKFESLKKDIETDVLIIGGGIAGILCGYELQKAGIKYVIAEADEICSGTTGNTTAKITFHHGAIFDKMIERFGEYTAKLYIKANNAAIEEYEKICKDIDCDFEICDSYVYSKNDKNKILREVSALKKLGVDAEFAPKIDLPFKTAGAVRVKNQAQFNPLKFLYAISKELNIYEKTKVLELKSDCAITNHAKIKAKKIIVATHFPFINKHGSYFLKMYQHRSYVLGLENAKNVKGIYVDEADDGLSFRNYNGMLLLGGGGHRTGKTGGNLAELRAVAKKYYPDSKEIFAWGAQDCKTLDEIAYIGKYSFNTPELYVATGFNKWGMTGAMVSAIILTDMIKSKKNEWATVFTPQRSIIRPKLAENTVEAIKGFLNLGAPRCPHLGCALTYNKAEHSWDCSCHGSRFSEDGKLLDNPATSNAKF